MDRVKSGATVVFVMDLIVALGWCACAVMLLAVHCIEITFVHLFILGHFAVQTVALADIIGEVRIAEWEQQEEAKGNAEWLQHHSPPGKPFMTPITWGLASMLALVGDVLLIAYDSIHFHEIHWEGGCRKAVIFQLIIEAGTCLTAGISMICFVVAAYYINQHREARQERYGMQLLESHVYTSNNMFNGNGASTVNSGRKKMGHKRK